MPPTARPNSNPGLPKRRPSRSAIGRAPMATMSRRIPPTPVAAPWKGSTAEGWLWLSTLNATASPSPRSTTPAFSPGPWSTRDPAEGSRRSSRAECLYAQCSDQRSEKTASSKWFGSRPSSSQILSSSPSVRPSARWRGCSTIVVREAILVASPDGSRAGAILAARLDGVRGYVPLLFLLGTIWGASFLFIEVADRALEPTTLMGARLLVAAAVLVPVFVVSRGGRSALAELGRVARPGMVAGVVAAALPFTLIAWGQKHIDSGTAAIANASMPIVVVLLALRVRKSESARGSRLVGVGVLAGANPPGGWWGVAGTMAVVAAAFFYAAGALYAQHHIEAVPVLVFST